MINFNDIGLWHFVSELDVIEVTSVGNVEVRITAADGAVLLSGTYIPVDGVVRVYHLHKLLSPLIMEVSATFTITVGDVSKSVHVVQSRIAVTETAADFLLSFFLTTVMTERDTALGRKELLTLLPIEATVPDVMAVALYWNGTQVVTSSHTLASGLTTGAVTEVEVKHTTADSDISDMTVTWRRSSLVSARLVPVRTPKLFDETFDETYN